MGLIDSYRKLEEFDESVALFNALEAKQTRLPGSIAANIYRGYAYSLACQGRLDEAKRYYDRATPLFGESNPFGVAHCRRGMGDIFVAEGSYDLAETAFRDAIDLYREANKTPSLGTALVELGRARLAKSRGDLVDASQKYGDVIKALGRDSLNEPFELGVAYEELGDVRHAQGNAGEAIGALRIALEVFRRCAVDRRAARVADKIDGVNAGQAAGLEIPTRSHVEPVV